MSNLERLLEKLSGDLEFRYIYSKASQSERWHLILGVCLGYGMRVEDAVTFTSQYEK